MNHSITQLVCYKTYIFIIIKQQLKCTHTTKYTACTGNVKKIVGNLFLKNRFKRSIQKILL